MIRGVLEAVFWQKFRHIMRALQGSIIISSALQALLGYTGLSSIFLRLVFCLCQPNFFLFCWYICDCQVDKPCRGFTDDCGGGALLFQLRLHSSRPVPGDRSPADLSRHRFLPRECTEHVPLRSSRKLSKIHSHSPELLQYLRRIAVFGHRVFLIYAVNILKGRSHPSAISQIGY